MPSLRLLQHWPWGCVLQKSQVPSGNFEFAPNSSCYWATTNLVQAMSWYYRVKTWRFAFFLKDPSENPISQEASETFSFSNELDVICADRSGLKITATTPPFNIGGGPLTATGQCFIFTTPPNPSQPTNLLTEHSVVLDGGFYAVFFSVEILLESTTGGFVLYRSNFIRPNISDLEVDGTKYFEATTSFLGYKVDIKIEPEEFFTFS